MSRKNSLWAAPLLTAAVLLTVYSSYGLYPFGTRTVSWCDMNQQVIPFLMDFQDILRGKAGMFLNLQNAGGMDFWGVFLFFLSSPFSFLAAFVPKGGMYDFVNLLLVLKMAACSFCACCFFIRTFPRLNFTETLSLGVMYAFCGYAMFYYQNIVWLDVMALFPILLLGLQQLIREGKILLYTLSFAAVLTVNFYLCYMVSIFLVLAFGTYLFFCCGREKRGEKTLLFVLSTLSGGLMTGTVWLPSLLQYLSSARTGDLFGSIRSGGFFTRIDTTLPVLMCTGAAAAAVGAVFLLRMQGERKIRWVLTVLLFVLTPVLIEPVNKMWHTGSYQSFPVRYGYIPAFLGLVLFAAALSGTGSDPRISGPQGPLPLGFGVFSVFAVAFSASAVLREDFDDVTAYTRTLWGDRKSFRILGLFFLTAALAYLVLLLLHEGGMLKRSFFSILLLAAAVVESSFYSSVYLASAGNNAQYYVPILDLADRTADPAARVKMREKYFDVNLIGGMGYGSLGHYTSLTAKDYLFSMKKLGYSSYWMEVSSSGGTAFSDAVLGNRYTGVRTSDVKKGQDIVYQNGLYSILKDPEALPVGFAARPSDIGSLGHLENSGRLSAQETIFQNLFSTGERLFEFYQPSSLRNLTISGSPEHKITLGKSGEPGSVLYRIPVEGTQTLYFDCFDEISNRLYEPINSSISISVDGRILKLEYPTQPDNGLVDLGTFTDRTVEVEIGVRRSISARSFGIAGLKRDVLSSALRTVRAADLRQTGNSLSGSVTADAGGEYLFLPVQNTGCTAYVNGEKVKVSRVLDAFLAVPLKKGKNSVRFSFTPPGFRASLLISVAGILFFLFLLRGRRTGRPGIGKALEKPALAAFFFLFFAVLFLIYVFPILIFFS